ncbi:Very-long-chain 3-oxooacyl-coA reductase, partial [Trichinella murrelli]
LHILLTFLLKMGFVLVLGYLFLAVVVIYLINTIWSIVYPHILAKPLGHITDLKKLGDWAVVTGATDGIGKHYAIELAKRGLNVFILGRNEERLKNAVEEIEKNAPNVEVFSFEVDFSQATPDTYAEIESILKKLDVAILVNNVGVSYAYPEYLHQIENGRSLMWNLLQVNCIPCTLITQSVLPNMLEKRKGAIVNIGSASGLFPTAFMSVYSASKAYVKFLTRNLIEEYRDSGLIFQCVSPFYVCSKMSKMNRPSFFVPDSSTFARSALNTVGLEEFTCGCLSHAILVSLINLIHPSILASSVTKRMKKARAKFLRNKGKKD